MIFLDFHYLGKVLFSAATSPLGLNVVGGLLSGFAVLLLSWIYTSFRRRWSAWRFKQIFGPGGDNGTYTLVYGALAFRSTADPHPYIKPGGDPRFGFSISQPVSICEVRAANYLASSIGKFVGATPALRSDLDVRANLDLDFISIGGPGSNFKTADCQSNAGNRLAIFDQQNQFVDRFTSQSLVKFEQGFDYGLILKVRPTQFPNRVWLMCAGLGEWGTSGSAWFLANKWGQIRKKAGGKAFATIVRVRPGQDESAESVHTIVDEKK